VHASDLQLPAEQVTRLGMRGVFHALCSCDSQSTALDILDYASGQAWLADLARDCQEVAELGRTRPVEPADEALQVRTRRTQ
jgi:hypothetical protein